MLNAILRWPDGLDAALIVTRLTASDFGFWQHQQVYRAALEVPPTTPTILADVYRRLVSVKKDFRPNLAAWIADVWMEDPIGANGVYYAGVVKELSVRRSLIHHCREVIRDAADGVWGPDEYAAVMGKLIL